MSSGTTVTPWIWLRHAPVAGHGMLTGRGDPPISEPDPQTLQALVRMLPRPASVLSSPARRCRQTLAVLRDAGASLADETVVPEFAEQDFGDWEGRDPAGLPWPRSAGLHTMAAFAPPGGESFADLSGRVQAGLPALVACHADGPVLVCAHAGTIRAALVAAMGAGTGCGLAFDIAPLSVTRLTAFGPAGWRIDAVNVHAEADGHATARAL